MKKKMDSRVASGRFPAFMRHACNAVRIGRRIRGLTGFVYEGADNVQLVIWESRSGGKSAPHTHDYDEYAVVVAGTFRGTIGGKPVTMVPGDECRIPAGTPHGGEYSIGYRAIDAFGGKRVERVQAKKQRRTSR